VLVSPVTEITECTQEDKRLALDHALHSRTFARSEQLRAFLRFVCEAEMRGTGADLTEYVIGVEVLGRPEGYSPAEDSSVRTRAYELRQKLEKLYATELQAEAIRIVVPKGAYAPQYVKAVATPHPDPPVETAVVVSAPVAVEAVRGGGGTWKLVAGGMAACLLGSALTFVGLRSAVPKAALMDPIVTEAWGPLAKPGSDVLLCAATPLHLVVGPAGHEAYGSPSYPAPPEAYPLFREHRPLEPSAKLGLIFTKNVLGVGTMNAVVVTANTLKAMGTTYQILPERVATISALRGRNAILFGAPVDSEAITRTLAQAPLTVDYEPSVKEFVVRDRTNGRMLVPKKDTNGDFVEVYGLVTVLSTRDSDRGRLGMVVFSGITSAGTHGAAEFFSSPRALRNLKAVLTKEGKHGFPAAYQVVVKCTFSNMLLLAYEYDSHKVLQTE
jgi:hypothetical protein